MFKSQQESPLRSTEELPDYDVSLKKKDFFPKIFLVPSEVRLEKGKDVPINLDKGLVVIKRTNEHPDKFEEEDVKDILINSSGQPTWEQNNSPAGHGLLSLFKKSNKRKIRLAICVCVYS